MTELTRLRVQTFNIRGGNNPEDSINTWSNRAALNVRTIQTRMPDIIGFQECQRDNLIVYQAAFHDYTFHLGHTIDRETYNPIFWKAARFDVIDGGQFWLSPIPHAPQTSSVWDAACPRAATWVKLCLKEKKLIVLLVNTHWDHVGEQARRESAWLVNQKVYELRQDHLLPTIVLGDFNCSPWRPPDDGRSGRPPTNEPYHYLLKQGFVDTFLAAGHLDTLSSNTFHGFMGEAYEPWRHHMLWRPDWILLLASKQHVRIQGSAIVRDGQPPLFPSDHYPVMTDFTISS